MRTSSTRKAVALLAAAALASFALVACGDDDDGTTSQPDTDVTFESGTTMATLNEQGSVTIGTKFDQPLFGLRTLDGDPERLDPRDGVVRRLN